MDTARAGTDDTCRAQDCPDSPQSIATHTRSSEAAAARHADLLAEAERAAAAGRPRVALLLLQAALHLAPSAHVLLRLARVMLRLERAAEALTLLDTLVAAGVDPAPFVLRGQAWLALENPSAASADFVEALARAPAHAEAAGLLAILLMERGDMAGSVRIMASAIDAGATDPMLTSAWAAGRRALHATPPLFAPPIRAAANHG